MTPQVSYIKTMKQLIITLRIFLWVSILCFFNGYFRADTLDAKDTNEIKFSLEKGEYVEGEDITLNIEFDFNKGDSTVYFAPYTIISEVLIINETESKCYRYNYYLISLSYYDSVNNTWSGPRIIFPGDSILPHQKKVLELEVNREFSFEDTFGTKNIHIIEYLPAGEYIIKFDPTGRSLNWLGRWVYAKDLKFKITSKK